MPKNDYQQEQLRQLRNNQLKGMSPARNEWTRAKDRSGIDKKILKQMFVLDLAGHLDALYNMGTSLTNLKSVFGAVTSGDKRNLRQLKDRTDGIIKQYKTWTEQRKKLMPEAGNWGTLLGGFLVIDTHNTRVTRKVL